jgi:outer membrane autotransporter protein
MRSRPEGSRSLGYKQDSQHTHSTREIAMSRHPSFNTTLFSSRCFALVVSTLPFIALAQTWETRAPVYSSATESDKAYINDNSTNTRTLHIDKRPGTGSGDMVYSGTNMQIRAVPALNGNGLFAIFLTNREPGSHLALYLTNATILAGAADDLTRQGYIGFYQGTAVIDGSAITQSRLKDVSITTFGFRALGIAVDSGTLTADGLKITSSGERAHGIYIGGRNNIEVNLSNPTIETYGINAAGVQFSADTTGNNPLKTLEINGGSIRSGSYALAFGEPGQSFGVDLAPLLNGNYNITIKGGAVLTGIEGAINAQTIVDLADSSQRDVPTRILLNVEEASILNGDVKIKDSADADLNFSGGASLNGNTSNDGSGILNLNLDNASITGSINNNASGETNLGLNGGVWNASGSNHVNTITGNSGTIRINDPAATFTFDNNQNARLDMIYSGSAHEALGETGREHIGDNIDIVNGHYANILFEEFSEQDGFSLLLGPGGVVGGHRNLGNTNVTNACAGEINGYMLLLSDQNNLNKRLGALRDSGGKTGVWVRAHGSKREYSERDVDVSADFTTFQLGADHKLTPQWMLGVAVSHTRGTSDIRNHQVRGSGESRSTGGAVYGVWLGETGDYVDLIARYGSHRNEISAHASTGVTHRADFDNSAYSLGAEYGKRFALPNAFFVEPQVELIYGQLGSAAYHSGNVKVRQDALTSAVGRVGAALGRSFTGYGNVYLRAGVLHEFDGRANVRVGTRKEQLDFSGTGFEIGVGANLKFQKNVHLYVDVEKSSGSRITTNWQWNMGVRYDF